MSWSSLVPAHRVSTVMATITTTYRWAKQVLLNIIPPTCTHRCMDNPFYMTQFKHVFDGQDFLSQLRCSLLLDTFSKFEIMSNNPQDNTCYYLKARKVPLTNKSKYFLLGGLILIRVLKQIFYIMSNKQSFYR